MAIGRAYPIKKSAVKAYGYTKPPKKRHVSNGPRFAANGSVTHIAAINGRGAYRGRTARSRMSGLSSNARRTAATSSLSAAKKAAFARSMRAEKKASGSSRLRSNGSRLRVKRKRFSANHAGWAKTRSAPGKKKFRTTAAARSAARSRAARSAAATRKRKSMRATRAPDGSIVYVPRRKTKISRRSKPTRRKATRKTPMARKTRRRKKAAARSTPVRRVKRRVKRRKSAKRSAVAPKRRKRRKARKTALKATPKRKRRRKAKATLKANPRRARRRTRRSSRRRLKKNYGTRAGALKGWRKRRAKRKTTSKRKRRSRKASAVAPKRKRRSRRKSRALKANPRRRRRAKRRSSLRANPRRRRSSRRRLSANRKRRSPARRRMRRNGRSRMFRKNGILDPILFIAKTGGIALVGLLAHKIITNALVTYGLNKFLDAPAAVVVTSPSTTAVLPSTAGLGGLSLDPQYQRVLGSFVVAGLGVYASTKVIKDPTVRNTVMTGIGLSFMTTLFSAVLTKFAPQYSGILAGPNDGTAARLSAMYGFGGTSIQPRYQAISGRGPMGEYFESGVSGMGEYFTSGVSGLGEYFQSGVNGLGAIPSYEANAGYGANPDLMEAAAGMGARETMNTNHIDPHGDLDRQLTIAEAAAGVGAFEAAAGFGNISTVPSSSTWIPGMSDGQLWAGTRSISSPQSATELTPAGILQTDGGQGVFG